MVEIINILCRTLATHISFAQIAGSTCQNPIVITTLPYTTSDDTANYGDDYGNKSVPSLTGAQYAEGTGSGYYLAGNDAVYSFTPEENGVFNFNLTLPASGWHALWLFEGCPFTTTVAYHTAISDSTRSLPSISLQAGTTYYIVVSTWDDSPQTTPYTLEVTQLLCPVPTSVVFSDVTTDSVTVGWTASGTETAWDYAVQPIGSGIPLTFESTTSTTLTISGLSDSTNYEFYVRANCGGSNGESVWVGPHNFSTAQTLTEGQTLADLVVGGANLTWYSDASLTEEIPATTEAVDGTTYYVTQTIDGCESEALAITVTVVNPCAGIIAPTGETTQTLTEGQTLADLVVEGANLTWYSDASLTEEIPATTEAVDGTTYYVTQTIDGCESEALAIYVEVTLSTDRFDEASFRAYPNPVRDILNISYSKDISEVAVINMLGQVVISEQVSATDAKVDMSGLPTGNYLVKVMVDGAVKTIKVVKQ